MEDSRRKLMVATNDEITRICGGNTEYLDDGWLLANAPGILLIITDASTQILSPTVELLPLPVLESLLGLFVAAHCHAHAMWMHRDELGQLSQRPAPGTH